MQHLDEGTIHSWLDGALTADEAARVEGHVADCPQCEAAVAEARGFIAASSRILTALDHVPRGVVPAAIPVKWYNRAAWRAAAGVLVVAVGSLVVVRNGRNEAVGVHQYPMADSTSTPKTLPSAPPIIIPATPTTTAATATPSTRGGVVSGVASSDRAAAEADFSGKPISGAAPASGNARERVKIQSVDGAVPPQVAGALTAAPQAAATSGVAGLTTVDAAGEQTLKEVGRRRMIGAKVTRYEVAPGDTVTLTEIQTLQLNGIVTGVATAQPMMGRAAGKSAAAPTQRADAEVARAPDSQIRVQAAQAPPPLQVGVVNGLTTISWPDATTGNMLKLSGRLPVERLKEIKLRIERERAAAVKKSP